MAGRAWGTEVRTGLNTGVLSRLVRGPGVDTRYWCAEGRVATVDDTGKPDYTDRHAIWNDSAGVDVDVFLPLLHRKVTCRYAGESAGAVTVLTPIRPGDPVLVESPDGDMAMPVITKILRGRARRQPVDENRKPIFDNNRMLIYAESVPIDIRTAGGVRVLLEQDGTVTITGATVKLGGPGADQSNMLGDNWKAFEAKVLGLIAAHSHPGDGSPPSNAAQFTAEANSLGDKLSTVVKTK